MNSVTRNKWKTELIICLIGHFINTMRLDWRQKWTALLRSLINPDIFSVSDRGSVTEISTECSNKHGSHHCTRTANSARDCLCGWVSGLWIRADRKVFFKGALYANGAAFLSRRRAGNNKYKYARTSVYMLYG